MIFTGASAGLAHADSEVGPYRLLPMAARRLKAFELVSAPPVEPRLPWLRARYYKERIRNLLARGRYGEADQLYRLVRHCYAPGTYEKERKGYWERHRAAALEEIGMLLAQFAFRKANDFAHRSRVVVGVEEYTRLKAAAVRRYFWERYEFSVNEEQAAALVCPARHVLVKARAGTGKTNTIVAKAVLSIVEEDLHPNQVLLLAFNRDAASEILRRIRDKFRLPDFATAKTFHSLAYRLVHPDKDIPENDEVRLEMVEEAMKRVWTPAFRRLVNAFFGAAEDMELKPEQRMDPATLLAYRRNDVKHLSISGLQVKSAGEKWIADFLYEHDIHFDYERVEWWWNNGIKQTYRPDFTIRPAPTFETVAVIEHWGVSSKDKDTDKLFDDGTTVGQYREQIRAKRRYWLDKGIPLLETSVDDMKQGRAAFEAKLKAMLEELGIECVRLPDVELEKKLRPRYWNTLTRQFNQFIQRAKNRRMPPAEAKRLWRTMRKGSLRTRIFWGLAARVYAGYERLLAEGDLMDFQDLLAEAARRIEQAQGKLSFVPEPRKEPVPLQELRWLLVDEYQDFSPGFDHLVKTMRKYNPGLRLFCVGDDWQTINRFAGSEPHYFRDFATHFENSEQVLLRINHRSPKKIVETSNRLMLGHGEPGVWQPGKVGGKVFATCVEELWVPKELIPRKGNVAKTDAPPTDEVDDVEDVSGMDDAPVSEKPTDKPLFDAGYMRIKTMLVCFGLICASLKPVVPPPTDHESNDSMPKVAILSRTNWILGQKLFGFHKELLKMLPPEYANGVHIEVTTIHKYKGQQADLVILVDVTAGQIPLLHKDNELYAPFLGPGADPMEEARIDERRLFYVALSRATEMLWILTETGQVSPFLQELNVKFVEAKFIPIVNPISPVPMLVGN